MRQVSKTMCMELSEKSHIDSNKQEEKLVNNIKAVIKESGLKQKAICKKLGISEAMLSHYIHDRRIPPQDTIRKLRSILNTSVINLYPKARKIVYWKLNAE